MAKQNKPAIRFKGFTDAWEQRKLGELLKTITTGKSVNSDDGAVAVGDIGILKTSCVSYDRFNPYESKPVVKDELQSVKCAVEKDSVIVSRMNTPERVGACGYVSTDFPNLFLPDRLWKLKFQDNVDAYFVYMMLVSSVYKEKITSMASGTSGSMYNIPKETFLNLQLVVPVQTSEQRKIGQVLRQLNDLITLHQRKFEKLTNVKKSMLEKMFPQNGSSYPEIRFKGFTDPWEQRKLGELMNVTSVKRIHQSDWTDSGVRFLRARDIVSAAKNEEPDDYLYISKEKYEEYSALSGKVSVSDLLVTGVGTIGVPYLVRNLEPLYFKDGNIIWFQNSDKIDGKFLFYSFLAEQIQGFINESAGIGTVGTYTIESGKKTPISLPNQIEQAKVGAFFQQLDNLITLHQRELEKLQNIKKSMLEKMFV